jgi:predicted ATPase
VEQGRTILLDEPENFVALAEIQPWLLRFVDAVDEQGAQAIVVSHHPEVLNTLASGGAVVFDRPQGGPTRVSPFPISTNEPLTPSEIVARGWERFGA